MLNSNKKQESTLTLDRPLASRSFPAALALRITCLASRSARATKCICMLPLIEYIYELIAPGSAYTLRRNVSKTIHDSWRTCCSDALAMTETASQWTEQHGRIPRLRVCGICTPVSRLPCTISTAARRCSATSVFWP